MELVIVAAIVAVGAAWYFYRKKPEVLDTNNDGKIDIADVAPIVEKVLTPVAAAPVVEAPKAEPVEAKKPRVGKKAATSAKAADSAKKATKKSATKKPKVTK